MENRKTAMQELFDNLESIDIKVPIGVKKIFLEKEKAQIINTFKGAQVLHTMNDQMRGEQYFNEIYGSEGSDAKDVVLGYKTSLDAQMLDRIEPKQERMYSEEDMAESFMACWKANVPEGFECKLSFNEWFEQCKKK